MQETENDICRTLFLLKLARVPASRQNIARRKKIWMRLRGRLRLVAFFFFDTIPL